MSVEATSLQLHPPMPEFSDLDWLWYEKSTHKKEWFFSSTGVLPSVIRMINGLPSYPRQHVTIEREKRKLILNDWTAEKWSPKKIEETKERFLALLEAGHEIYAWQNDEDVPLVKLNKEMLENDILSNQDFRDNITPVSVQKLREIAGSAPYNIGSKALEFLNCVHIKELLGHDGWVQDKKYYVTLTDLINSTFSNEKLIERIIEEHNGEIFADIAKTPHEEGIISFWRTIQHNVKLINKLPVTLEVSYGNVYDIAAFYDSEKKEALDNLQNLKLVGVNNFLHLGSIYTQKKYMSIKSLSASWTNFSVIGVLLGVASLKNLELNNHTDEVADYSIEDFDVFKDLQSLNLSKVKFHSFGFVKNILMSATELESFTYEADQPQGLGLDEEEIKRTGAFSNLKSLVIDGDIEPRDLVIILKYAKNLEHLTLKNCLKQPNINMLGCAFPKLRSLTVEGVSLGVCQSILESTDELSYYSCKDIATGPKVFHNVSLEKLKTFSTINTIKVYLIWDAFLKKAHHLEKLILDHWYGSPLSVEQLKHLKELEVVGNTINLEILQEIVREAQGLKKLFIEEYPSDIDISPSMLEKLHANHLLKAPHLKELKTASNILTNQNLNDFLKTFYPKLTRLDITGCANIQDLPIGFFSKDFLNRLEEIIINQDQVVPELAKEILEHSPNLNKKSITCLKNCMGSQIKMHLPSDDVSTVQAENLGSNAPSISSPVDMNTQLNPDKQYNLTQIFWGINTQNPHPTHYRINVYDALQLNPISFIHKNDDEAALQLSELTHKPYISDDDTFKLGSSIPLVQEEQCFYGKTQITLSPRWYPLPSLSPKEILTHIHLSGVSKEEFELRYSKRDHLYYIRATGEESRSVSVDFLLKTPESIERTGMNCLSEGIRALAAKYRKNKEDIPGASDDCGNKTDEEILVDLRSQKLVGACRHRALAFKAEADDLIQGGHCPGISKVNVITNDCHSYIEVEEEVKGEIITIDLGGHPAMINISDINAPPDAAKTPSTIILPTNTSELSGIPASKEETERRIIERSVFNTWSEKQPLAPNVLSYMYHLLQGKSTTKRDQEYVQRALVKLDSREALEDFRLYLQKFGSSFHDREIYYIDSPEDLRCSANWIKREGNKGTPMPGPGGPLDAFLKRDDFNPQKGGKKTPILLVNWDNFKPEQVIQFNSLYANKGRRADGTLLPEHTRIIGLYNKSNPKAYKGKDFNRCWEDKSNFPEYFKPALKTLVEKEQLREFWPPKPDKEGVELNIIIDLYESENWEELLLGRWSLQGSELIFKEGVLEAALEEAKTKGKTIELKNAPWQDEKFKVFWQQLRLKGALDSPSGIVSIQSSSGYAWQSLFESAIPLIRLERSESAPENANVLNPSNFVQYLHIHQYQAMGKGELNEKPGWLEQYKKEKGTENPMSLYLTRELSKHQWGQLFDAAKEQGVRLNIRAAKDVSLPTELEPFVQTVEEEKSATSLVTTVYLSEDIDFTVESLKAQYSDELCIEISEYEAHHLLEDLTPIVQGLKYAFKYKEQAVLKSLMDGKTVILKGHFKPELIDALSSLCVPNAHIFVNGKRCVVPGKLILVTDSEKHLGFTKVIKEDNKAIVEAKEKMRDKIQKDIKESKESTINEWLAKQSYVQLQAIQRHLQTGGLNPKDNWNGFSDVAQLEPEILDLSVYKKTSDDFKQARFLQIHNVLQHKQNPYVFIAGMTGVGKSSFIRKELEKISGSPYKVYFNLEEWAKPVENPKELKVLFIDEANIDMGDFSAFEGLMDNPPHMLIDGKDVLLKNHKVIFAGNPLSYGSRKLPALFARHGGAIIFPPMSGAYIYERVLQPILKDLPEQQQEAIGYKILEVYQKILPLSKDTVLISPRELEMMALLVVSEQYKNPEVFTLDKVDRVIGKIIRPLIPSAHQSSFAKWLDASKPATEAIVLPATSTTDAFLITPSRAAAYEHLQDFLALRKLKQETTNEAIQKAPGLGGLILEGEPGVGKSEFIVNSLVHAGFEEMHFKEGEIIESSKVKDGFYRMPASMQSSDKDALLTRALHDGHWVLVDEMNACPMMERAINAATMGQDLSGHDAKEPGHVFVSAQNFASTEARSAFSVAIERRCVKDIFEHYSPPEMEDILQNRGLSKEEAQFLVEDYWLARQYAKEHKKEYGPTFGDLIQVADLKLKAKARNKPLPEFKEKEEAEEKLRSRTYLPLQQMQTDREASTAEVQDFPRTPSKFTPD